MISTTAGKSEKRKKTVRIWTVAFWLAVWEIASIQIGQEILLASPVSVLIRFFTLALSLPFWRSAAFSFLRISGGFLTAMAAGTVLAGLSHRFTRVEELLAPVMLAVKATPVASFIILALIWVPSKNLSVLISFLMVLPVIYTNVLGGVRNTDSKLLEMAAVFRIPLYRRIRYIYMPQVMPFFRSACSVALGMSWKAGTAAEVIGIPKGSIGEKLYQAKIYLDTPDLFAWTITIVLISLLFERIFLLALDCLWRRLER